MLDSNRKEKMITKEQIETMLADLDDSQKVFREILELAKVSVEIQKENRELETRLAERDRCAGSVDRLRQEVECLRSQRDEAQSKLKAIRDFLTLPCETA